MKLYIDSGATKSEFVLLNGNNVAHHFITKGINANYADDQHITTVFNLFIESLDSIPVSEIDQIVYYGAGCLPEVNSKRVKTILHQVFGEKHIEVYSDLIAVCHALCGKDPGYIAILGTGSASCYYDGVQITDRAPSLGYFLGDEGSGTYMGKLFIQRYLKNRLPLEVVKSFETQYDVNVSKVYTKIYRELNHQSFLASLPHFMEHHLEFPEVKEIILQSFCDFFVAQNEYYKSENIVWNLSGSIAHYFSEILQEAALKSGMNVKKIIKAPLEHLIKNNHE